ncbi:fimbrial protein [Arsenophonus nasoniae]|uniref:Fimbria adhesin protein n=1 Tax=Arsenophonus nasoniae TaxID=638 RepID=A0A4P7L049_9GAMM|nr:fimbrial protein [Arsenophonus nasoniae]QBY43314.1 Fimbria adhesin protein [Arsenophonus nasoniae]WGM07323.1 fimbrial protein [Arsenophonus nasoniae]WGM12198.1 fimbrial protein [Arsenophonus nasoniae]WGM16878.1 fimbrial protein [Arsenophonus nasoniae]
MTSLLAKTISLFFLLLGLFSLTAHASNCNYMPGSQPIQVFIPLPNEIEVSPTLPVGSIIKKAYGSLTRGNYEGFIICQSEQIKHQWRNSHQYAILPSSDDIYPTNLKGIGLKIIYHAGNIQPYVAPCYNQSTNKVFCGETFYQIELQLIKTAEQIETGNISQQQLTEATIGDLPIVNFNLTNTQIIVPKLSCFINNNALEINLGRLKTTVFNGIYSTAGKKGFYLELNCSHPSTVEMKMDGDTLPSSDDRILALNKYNAAQGIGLQILYKNNPIKFNDWFILKKVPGTESIQLFFYAQYIQVAEQVTPGQANALVTYHIKYH